MLRQMTEAYKTIDPTAPEIEIASQGRDLGGLRGHRGHYISLLKV